MRVESVVSEAAKRWPRKAAIIDDDGVLDYQSLAGHVDDVRRQVQAMGVCDGDGVGILARNGRGFIIGALGALSAGATIMPISHQLARNEIFALLSDAPVRFVVDDGSASALFGPADRELGACGKQTRLHARATNIGRTSPFVEGVSNPAFVRFTSGTTGASKGVVLTHEAMLERSAAANGALGLGPDDTVVWVLPMAFHFVVSIVLYLRYGATIAVARDHLAETIAEVSNRHSATLLYASPLHYRGLLASKHVSSLATLRRAVSTSTALAEQIARPFAERYGLPITQAYGIIEVGLPLMNLRCAREQPLAVGHPLPGYEVAIVDDRYGSLPEGQTGELAMRGPGMFAAYLWPFQRCEDVLRNQWFLTGDLAKQDPDGLVTIVGRLKAMINVAGNKVFAEEVECVLDSHPRVERSRVLGRPHPRMGEVLHAQVVLRHADGPCEPDELLTYCRARLSSYRVPHTLEIVDALVLTPSGKIRRNTP